QPPNPASQDVPVQVEDRLPRSAADVHDHLVVLESLVARGVGDEVEHSTSLFGRELAHFAKGLDVPLRDHEQVSVCLWVDVADRDEAVRCIDVLSVAVELAEEAVVGAHAARIPSSVTAAARTRTSRPTSPRTSHGE